MNRTERYTGCLVGGAIGDALGAPVEFMSVDQIRYTYGPEGITDYVEYPGNLGEFTDDTQMTLFTAEGLLRAYHRASVKGIGGAIIPLTYQAYRRWLHTQGESMNPCPNGWGEPGLDSGWLIREKGLFRRRAPGITCIQSLKSGLPGSLEAPANTSKGCGTIMRMAPVGLILNDPEFAFKTGCELAALTHGHPTGYLSAGYFASLIGHLNNGIGLEEAINQSSRILQGWSGHEETLNAVNKALELFKRIQPIEPGKSNFIPGMIEILGRGWIAEEALAISLFCSLLYTGDFTNGVLASVNHNGDSDSTGSITGNILGTINGIGAIPEKWIRNLRSAEIVRQVGEDLATGCKGDTDDIDEEWWEKYPGW